jgi:hypothetical protein
VRDTYDHFDRAVSLVTFVKWVAETWPGKAMAASVMGVATSVWAYLYQAPWWQIFIAGLVAIAAVLVIIMAVAKFWDRIAHRREAQPSDARVALARLALKQVLDLLAERIRKPGKPANAHPHRQVLALNKAGRYVTLVGIPGDYGALRADHMRRTVATSSNRFSFVKFDYLAIVDIGAEHPLCRFYVGTERIR